MASMAKISYTAQSAPFGIPFPVSIHSGGRYLIGAGNQPYFIHGDTPWSIASQLTNAQIDTYLNDRQSKGFNAIMFNAPEKYFTSQSPSYNNADGVRPFTTTSHTAASFESLNEAYWQRVDYIVQQARNKGMLCVIQPAYLGFGGGSGASTDQGWDYQVNAATAGNLQTYGSTLATRYGSYGNVIWCMGGDYVPADVTKQWNIATGIRSVTPNAIITAHGSRAVSAYSSWSGQSGFNLNNIYSDTEEYALAATEYARAGPMPFFLIESQYDGGPATPADCRRTAYTSILSGACGHFFGNYPIWGFGEPNANGGAGAADALSTSLSTTATLQMAYVKALFTAYQWGLLVPKTDTSLVSSSLGSAGTRVCPARASDGSFAMVWIPTSQSVTVVMSALSPSSVRARLYNTTDGTYSTVSGSPFANTGTQSIASGGERVLVLDAA